MKTEFHDNENIISNDNNNEQNESHHSEMIEHEDVPQQNLNFNIAGSNEDEDNVDNNNIETTKQNEEIDNKEDDINDSFDRKLQELRDKISKNKTRLKKHTPSSIQFRNSLNKQDTFENKSNRLTTGSRLGELYSMVNPMQNISQINKTNVSDQRQYFQSYKPFVSKNKALNTYHNRNNNSVQNVNNYLHINYNVRTKASNNNKDNNNKSTSLNTNDIFWNAYEQRNNNKKESVFNKEFYLGHLNQFGDKLFGRNQTTDNDSMNVKKDDFNNDNTNNNTDINTQRFHRLNLFI